MRDNLIPFISIGRSSYTVYRLNRNQSFRNRSSFFKWGHENSDFMMTWNCYLGHSWMPYRSRIEIKYSKAICLRFQPQHSVFVFLTVTLTHLFPVKSHFFCLVWNKSETWSTTAAIQIRPLGCHTVSTGNTQKDWIFLTYRYMFRHTLQAIIRSLYKLKKEMRHYTCCV
jgi:hypothetical protein